MIHSNKKMKEFMTKVHSLLVRLDKNCDYIPVVSTLSNLVDLFQKYAVIPLISESKLKDHRYYTHLNQKSIVDCLLMAIPVIGNIFAYYRPQQRKTDDQKVKPQDLNPQEPKAVEKIIISVDEALEEIENDYTAILRLGDKVELSAEFLLRALEVNCKVAEFIQDTAILQKAINANPKVLEYLHPDLRSDEEFIKQVLIESPHVFKYMPDPICHNTKLVIEVLKQMQIKIERESEKAEEQIGQTSRRALEELENLNKRIL